MVMIHGEGENICEENRHFHLIFVVFSYSLSLVDALDTLATLGNTTEFARVYHLVQQLDIERDINVSVFETNIRGKM